MIRPAVPHRLLRHRRRWLAWATATVGAWPDDVTDAPFDRTAATEAVQLEQHIPAILHADG